MPDNALPNSVSTAVASHMLGICESTLRRRVKEGEGVHHGDNVIRPFSTGSYVRWATEPLFDALGISGKPDRCREVLGVANDAVDAQRARYRR